MLILEVRFLIFLGYDFVGFLKIIYNWINEEFYIYIFSFKLNIVIRVKRECYCYVMFFIWMYFVDLF